MAGMLNEFTEKQKFLKVSIVSNVYRSGERDCVLVSVR